MSVNDVEVKHPDSVISHTRIDDLHFTLSATPGNKDESYIILSVFIDGKQHVIFNGTPDAAKEFFSRFPKN
jgi:hypothetical protein